MATITASRAGALTIGALSRRTGVNIETIRYYERIQLLGKPPRTAGGHRSYAPEHMQRLHFVRRARALGFGIENIRALLDLSAREPDSCAEVREIAAAHLTDVRAKLDDLRKLEKILTETVNQCDQQCCGATAPPCPVLEILSA